MKERKNSKRKRRQGKKKNSQQPRHDTRKRKRKGRETGWSGDEPRYIPFWGRGDVGTVSTPAATTTSSCARRTKPPESAQTGLLDDEYGSLIRMTER